MHPPVSPADNAQPEDEGRRQSSADKTLEILVALGELGLKSDDGVRLTDLVEHTGHPRPTVHRLLGELRRFGFATQDEASGRYRLGPKLLVLSAQCLGGLDLRRIAQPFMRELVDDIGFMAHLGIMDKHWIVYIDKVESTQVVRIVSSIGQRREASTTAIGKAILAYSPRQVVDDLIGEGLPLRTPRSIGTAEALFDELKRTRVRGFALDNEECDLGICCVAAPIFDHSGTVIAAISVTMMVSQVAGGDIERIGNTVAATALKISEGLGRMEWTPWAGQG
ncbi:IclR family transcriptional regulator [Telmatospirillum siberiense]|uniref:IclR family transcriptional regulator n=1 Tax=Telmatospirillum siberiense TaxID=382514 RepID=A0A2N3PW89_9PROT|nr:IclR family transcriptional regulator [Telmatospirillum siberiense]PKU24669.1 IclR family transcriptional regulator [Telmatospirillum siberiense]